MGMPDRKVTLWAVISGTWSDPKLEDTTAVEKPKTYRADRRLPGYNYKTSVPKKEAHLTPQAAVDARVAALEDEAAGLMNRGKTLLEYAAKVKALLPVEEKTDA